MKVPCFQWFRMDLTELRAHHITKELSILTLLLNVFNQHLSGHMAPLSGQYRFPGPFFYSSLVTICKSTRPHLSASSWLGFFATVRPTNELPLHSFTRTRIKRHEQTNYTDPWWTVNIYYTVELNNLEKGKTEKECFQYAQSLTAKIFSSKIAAFCSLLVTGNESYQLYDKMLNKTKTWGNWRVCWCHKNTALGTALHYFLKRLPLA